MIGIEDGREKVFQSLRGMAAKKILLVPFDKKALPRIEWLHRRDPSMLVAREGMSVWTR